MSFRSNISPPRAVKSRGNFRKGTTDFGYEEGGKFVLILHQIFPSSLKFFVFQNNGKLIFFFSVTKLDGTKKKKRSVNYAYFFLTPETVFIRQTLN